MKYYVYILLSQNTGRYYVGSSKNPTKRLEKHNKGHSFATKAYRPWVIIHLEEFENKALALKREIAIKRQKTRVFIKKLIKR